MDIQLRTTKQRTITGSQNGSTNQQHQNHCLRTDSNLSQREVLNAFYWYHIFSLDSAVDEAHNMLAWKLKAAKTTVTSYKVRKGGKDQDAIQSSTTPDPGYHMGK